MKTIAKIFVIGIGAWTLASDSPAVTLSFEPLTQSIDVGNAASVNVVVSDLGNFVAPSLGGFDIDFSYNPAVVSADSLTFGSQLDLGTLGSAQFDDLSLPGLIHLDEVSFESPDDLNDNQPDSFTLATIGFTGLAAGSSPLIFGNLSLSDENGITIGDIEIKTGLIEVVGGRGVPDAGATGFLLAGGLLGLWRFRRQLAQKELPPLP